MNTLASNPTLLETGESGVALLGLMARSIATTAPQNNLDKCSRPRCAECLIVRHSLLVPKAVIPEASVRFGDKTGSPLTSICDSRSIRQQSQTCSTSMKNRKMDLL